MEERRIPLDKKANSPFLYNTKEQMDFEFKGLNAIDEFKKQKEDFVLLFNKILDRYEDILPFKYNKITISTETGYINASPISIGQQQNLFIATQGPKDNTIEDFWTMVWELKSKVIVMLCNLIENEKSKCENYWEAKMEKFKVEVKKENTHKMYFEREIQLINLSNKEERTVYQIHYTQWPDKGVPESKDLPIFSEINELVDKLNNDTKEPIIVHCSAGAGRTGTFISMYLLEKEIVKQIKDNCSIIRFNIFNLVRKLKEMRISMVQTREQYQLIYKFVTGLLDKLNN